MLVRDLIELLEGMDADMEVHFSYNYGDHWRTEVAPAISNVREGVVEYSEYHRMDKLVEHDDSDFDEETGEELVDVTLRRVVVLA
jgi:hypothetical protein